MRADQLQGILDARTRRRPSSLLNEHGRLMVIAADHPARGALLFPPDGDVTAAVDTAVSLLEQRK